MKPWQSVCLLVCFTAAVVTGVIAIDGERDIVAVPAACAGVYCFAYFLTGGFEL